MRQARVYQTDRGWRFTFAGKRYRRRTKDEAQALLDDLTSAAERAQVNRPDPLTIAGLCERWREQHGSAHAHEMLADFEDWELHAGGEVIASSAQLLGVIPQGYLMQYKRWLETQRTDRRERRQGMALSVEGVRKRVSVAKTVIRWGLVALDQRGRPYITSPGPEMPRCAKPKPRPKAISSGQYKRLLERLTQTDGRYPATHAIPVVEFLVETGCRPGEAVGLRWDELDEDGLAVTKSDHKTLERTGKPRVFSLNTRAREIVASQPRIGEHVFTNRLKQRYTVDGLGSIIARRGVTIYQLRHTFAQRAANAGIPHEEIIEQMGHESSGMIRHYCNVARKRLIAAAGRLDIHAGGAQPQPRLRLVGESA